MIISISSICNVHSEIYSRARPANEDIKRKMTLSLEGDLWRQIVYNIIVSYACKFRGMGND